MDTRSPIRILILGDYTVAPEGPNGKPEILTAARCASVEDALAALDRASIDVMLIATDLGSAGTFGFCGLVRELGFSGRILLMSAGVERQDAAKLRASGIFVVPLNSSSPELLAQVIRKLAAGETQVDFALSPAP